MLIIRQTIQVSDLLTFIFIDFSDWRRCLNLDLLSAKHFGIYLLKFFAYLLWFVVWHRLVFVAETLSVGSWVSASSMYLNLKGALKVWPLFMIFWVELSLGVRKRSFLLLFWLLGFNTNSWLRCGFGTRDWVLSVGVVRFGWGVNFRLRLFFHG